MANYRELLAPIAHLGVEDCGVWTSFYTLNPCSINLATGIVSSLTPAGAPERIPFFEWAEKNGLDYEQNENFKYASTHDLVPDIEEYILRSADSRHKNLSASAALIILSTLLAPVFTTPWKSGKTNLFHTCVAYSGDGKADYLKAIDRIIFSVLSTDVTIQQPGSPEGLLDALGLYNFGLISLSEGERLLASAEGTPLNGVLKVMDSLWANEKIKGKRNRSSSIASIDMGLASVYLQMVPHSFDAVLTNPEVSVGGISSRFSWCLGDENAESNENELEIVLPDDAIKRLKHLAKPFINAIVHNQNENEQKRQDFKSKPFPISFEKEPALIPLQIAPSYQLQFGYGARELFIEWRREFKEETKRWREKYPTLSSMYIRLAEKILREATLLSAYEQAYEEKKVVTVDALKRVRSFEEHLISETKDHFRMADASGEHERVREKIIIRLSKLKSGERRADLRKNVRTKDKSVFDMVIRQLEIDGIIEDIPDIGRTGKNISRLFVIGEKAKEQPKQAEKANEPIGEMPF